MEILPQKGENQKSNKRVRFSLPDEADEVPPSEPKRRKSPNGKEKKKNRLKKTILRKVHLVEQRKLKSANQDNMDNEDQVLVGEPYRFSAGESSSSELMQEGLDLTDSLDLTDNEVLDKNENCVIRADQCKSVKRSSFVLRKKTSVSSRCNGKERGDGRCSEKRKVVVSKKSRLKGKESEKYIKGRKRKCDDSSTLRKQKKSRASCEKLKKGKKGLAKKSKRHYKSSKGRSKNNTSKIKQNRSKSTSSKVKTTQNKVKIAANKICKVQTSKQRLLTSRYKERMEKAAQKKLALKRSSAKKRKENKKKITMKKKKATSRRNVKKRHQGIRKVRIIKIERELDVVEPLRVLLLKYLTFERAYEKNFDCCRKYCWDDWEEIDMFDIIDDHD